MVAEPVVVTTGFAIFLAGLCARPREREALEDAAAEGNPPEDERSEEELEERWTRIVRVALRVQRVRRIFHNTGVYLQDIRRRGQGERQTRRTPRQQQWRRG